MRIGFVPILTPEDFAKACSWAVSRGATMPRSGIPTWWIQREDGETLGVTQRALAPVLGLALDPQKGTARETVAILDALRQAAELSGDVPLVITHEDSAMAALHDRMLESAGEKVRVYWFKKTER